MSDYLQKIVTLTKAQYDTLVHDRTLDYGSGTITYNPNNIYLTTDENITTQDLGDVVVPVGKGGTGRTSVTTGSVLIGGATGEPLGELGATNLNTDNTLVQRDSTGSFNAQDITLDGILTAGTIDGGQHIINGNVQLNSRSGSYNEGLRINRSTTGYANIYLGGTRNSASGNQAGGWWIGTLSTPADATSSGNAITNTVFTISNNNTSDTLSIKGTRGATIGTNSGWAIRPRLAVGTTYQTGYNFYVNGNTQFDIGTNDTTAYKRFKILGNGRFISLGGSGIMAYNTSNGTDSNGTLNIQYYGGNVNFGYSSSTVTTTIYGSLTLPTNSTAFNFSGIGATTSDNVARNIWFSYNGQRGTPVYDDNFKYIPYTNTLSIGTGTLTATEYSGNAATASKATAANLTTTANTFVIFNNTTGTFADTNLQYWQNTAAAGKTYVGWVKFASIDMNTNNQWGDKIYDIFLDRTYNSPASEVYNIRVSVGWTNSNIIQLSGHAGNQIMTKFRIVRNHNTHKAYFEYYVNPSYSTYQNTVGIKILCYHGAAVTLMNEVQTENDSNFAYKEEIDLANGMVSNGNFSGTFDGNATTATTATYSTYIQGIDQGTGNINIANTITSLGEGKIRYDYRIGKDSTGLFAHSTESNTNAILTFSTASGANYMHQLGFSTDEHLYHRAFIGVAQTNDKAWNEILDSSNYTDYLTTANVQSVLGISSSGSTTKWLNEKGSWTTPTASDVGAAPSSTVSCTAANVKTALGISSSGSATKWLNEKGSWVTPTASDIGAAPAVTGGYLPLSGGTMTGQITLHSTGYKTSNISGYSVDQYGNFKHQTTTAANVFEIQKNNGTATFKVTYESGEVAAAKYVVDAKVRLEYNTTDDSLDFVFI